ncbi:Outer membrane protein assembly factor BamD [Gimesia aquarii]|uniref:Outer membrane protein assembly factor BamD n=2 Tax=Gimesia aquarii TaxID=2527964 RepID=A0A517VR46_9PLAN|nr:Outer membrane protein assembly factor BamD [Gimesia aquarii]
MTTMSIYQLNYLFRCVQPAIRLCVALMLCGLISGCTMFGDRSSDFAAWKPPWSKKSATDNPSIDGIRGPMQRVMQTALWKKKKDSTFIEPALGAREFKLANEKFQAKEYKAAEKEFKAIVKKYKNDPIREDAQFMVAESQFAQKKYSWAQDGYDQLLIDFPSTRHLDQTTKRLFHIARYWLQEPSIVTGNDIQQVNLEDPGSETPEIPSDGKQRESRWALVPNFFDRTRPVFDTENRALEALKSIWLHDPTGPLADDSLMLTASYYLKKGRYMDADRTFSLLREEYPKSPHLKDAFMLGTHVKLMSYQGPQYDSTVLNDAGELKETTLRLFPESERARLKEELKKIEKAKAKRDWETVQYWMRRGKPKSAAIYCNLLIEKYPTSSFANEARELLSELGEENTNHLWANYATPKKMVQQQPEPKRSLVPSLPSFGNTPPTPPKSARAPATNQELEPPARLRLDELDEPIRRIPIEEDSKPAKIKL